MKTQSILLTTATSLVVFGLLLLLIRFLGRKLRPVSENQEGLKTSYAIYSGSLLISGAILFLRALPLIPEGFEIQWNIYSESYVIEALQFVATLTGFTFLWLLCVVFISRFLTPVILGDRTDTIEMERDNAPYFIVNGLSVIGLSLIAASVIEIFLRIFMPVMDTPYYH